MPSFDPWWGIGILWTTILVIVLWVKGRKYSVEKVEYQESSTDLENLVAKISEHYQIPIQKQDIWYFFDLGEVRIWLGMVQNHLRLRIRFVGLAEAWPEFQMNPRPAKRADWESQKPGYREWLGSEDFLSPFQIWMRPSERRNGLPKESIQWLHKMLLLPGEQHLISFKKDKQGILLQFRLYDTHFIHLHKLIERIQQSSILQRRALMLNTEIFRANDIRGIAETDLNSQSAETIGLGFGTMIRGQGLSKITVGADVRTHSPRIKEAFIKGLLATGCQVIDIGTIPTPVSYFSAFNVDTEATAVITASHNPSDYNGVKLGIGKGTIFGEAIQDLLKICQKGEFIKGEGSVESLDVTAMYTTWMKENFAHLAKQPLKIVVDPANATGALFFPQLVQDLGQDMIPLYCEVDGTFPNHHPDPTVPENVEDMKNLLLTKGADLGLGFDGDSDRIGVLDDKGRMVPGDLLTALFAREILKTQPGAPICFEVKSSQALDEVVRAHGGQPIMWKVGHSFLKTKMKELKAPLAGEVSGHMFFADRYFGYDDAFYCALRVIELVQNSGKKLSELVDELPQYVATPELRVECVNDTVKREMAEKAVAHFKASGLEINDLDGVRIMFGDGWGLVRASNTQPVLVTRFEARTPERLEEIKESVFDVLRQFGPVVLGGH